MKEMFSGQLGLESLIIGAKDVPIAKSRTKMISWPTGAGKSDYRRSEGMSGGQAGAKTFRCDMEDVPNPDSRKCEEVFWLTGTGMPEHLKLRARRRSGRALS